MRTTRNWKESAWLGPGQGSSVGFKRGVLSIMFAQQWIYYYLGGGEPPPHAGPTIAPFIVPLLQSSTC